MDTYLRILKRRSLEEDTPEAQATYIAALERALGGVDPTPPVIYDPEWPNEVVVQTLHGTQLRCPAYPEPVSYLRVCGPEGNEIAYWTVEEWAVDEDESMEVIGAVIGALLGGNPNA